MNYIVMDLEWNQSYSGHIGEHPRMPFEIIEIGAVMMKRIWQKEEDLKKSVRNFWNGAVKIISFVPGVPWILPNYRQIWLSTIWTSFLVL